MANTNFKTAMQVYEEQYIQCFPYEAEVGDIIYPDQRRLQYNIRALINHQGYLLPRGSGRTSAICYMMMREFKVINSRHEYLCVCSHTNAIRHITQTFRYLCIHNKVDFIAPSVVNIENRDNNKTIRFVPLDELIEDHARMRGLGGMDKIWVDLEDSDFRKRYMPLHRPFDAGIMEERESILFLNQPMARPFVDILNKFCHENTRLYY